MSRLDAWGDWEEQAHASRYHAGILASKCSISIRQLERFIWDREQMQLHSWLAELRQRRAAVLISEGKTMKEIAFELGYNDPAQFSRDFRKFHGESPTSYRARQKCRVLISNVAIRSVSLLPLLTVVDF